MLLRFFMVEKLVLNVLSETVAEAELTAGRTAAVILPTIATAARAFAVLKFIPISFLTQNGVVNDF